MQRQLSASMAFEADYVYSTSFDNISARNPNLAYQANGLPFNTRLTNRLPYPDWGVISMRMNNRGRDGILAHAAGRLHEAFEQPLAGLSHLLV